MEGSPPVPPPQQPVLPEEPPADQRPASVEDVRSVRRWAIVAGVWAAAATALAVIALLKPAQESEPDSAAAANRSVDRLQERLDERFEQLDERVGRLPQASDVQELQNRAKRVEDRARQAARDARAARDSIGRLQDRVEKVERAQKEQAAGSGQSAGSGGADSGAGAGGTTPPSPGGQP